MEAADKKKMWVPGTFGADSLENSWLEIPSYNRMMFKFGKSFKLKVLPSYHCFCWAWL